MSKLCRHPALMTIRTLISAIAFLVPFALSAQCLDNAEHAFALAESRHHPVMLIFSGSDWCTSCIRFEKSVLNNSLFKTFADSNLVLLRADFPQRRTLPDTLVAQNDSLAERYNPDGRFPRLVLLAPDRTVLRYVDYAGQPPETFINELTTVLQASSYE